jgi:flavin-dependent dehydrogenase
MKDRSARGVEGGFAAGHAVVVGAGIAGLLAGRVLADRFGRVTLLERDGAAPAAGVEGGPAFRKGAPQGRHLHTLASRGSEILERLFPGLDAELDASGCPAVDQGWDAETYTPAGRLPRFRSGLVIRSASRPLLEECLRLRLLAERPNVRLLRGAEAVALVPKGDRIAGVRTRDRAASPSPTDTSPEGVLEADLVLDASGAGSRAPLWLAALGYATPDEEVVDAGLIYATRWFRAEGYGLDRPRGISVLPDWPRNPRGGTMRLVEGGLLTVVLVGLAGEYPPTDEAGFLAFARALPSPAIQDAIEDLAPASHVYGFRRTANRRRRYERARLPEGFLVLGDAATHLNPSYGTGMTAAALSAAALETALEGALPGEAPRGLGRRFHRLQARAVEPCWTATTGSDRLWASGDEPGPAARLLYRVSEGVFALAVEDASVARTLLAVKNVSERPASLARPRVLLPALRHALLAPRREAPVPPAEPLRDAVGSRSGTPGETFGPRG